MIEIGDALMEVDDMDVYAKPLHEVAWRVPNTPQTAPWAHGAAPMRFQAPIFGPTQPECVSKPAR
jgi:hypothetical protein